MDDATCMVEIARFFLDFTQKESCGKCTPCRVGNAQMLEALDRLCKGKAQQSDLDRIGEIARYVQQASFCGLGQAAPVPILTGLKYFYEEFQARVQDR